MRKPNTTCVVCKKEIYVRPGQLVKNNGKSFCSKGCFGVSCRRPRLCPVCGKEFLAGSSRTKTCSRGCANKLRIGTNYGGGRPQSESAHSRALKKRLIEKRGGSCEVCGYSNTECLHAHHIIQRKDGGVDSEENLFLICRNCHGEIHFGVEGQALARQTALKAALGDKPSTGSTPVPSVDL